MTNFWKRFKANVPNLGPCTLIVLCTFSITLAIYDIGGKPTPFAPTVGLLTLLLWALINDKRS